MRDDQSTTSRPIKPSIEAFALPSELRRTHNFASRARPIIGLDLPSTPPPLNHNRTASSLQAELAKARLSVRPRVSSMPETDFLIESRFGDDDPPFTPPALWRNPTTPEPPPRDGWHWSERSTAGFLGFAAGLLIIVPVVFLIGANPNVAPQAPSAATSAPSATLQASTAFLGKLWHSTVDELQRLGLTDLLKAAPATTAATPAKASPPVAGGLMTDAEKHARAALMDGRLEQARSTLRAAASSDNPRLWFILAETYDPNVSAGKPIAAQPAVNGADTKAEVEFARFYYEQALSYGVEPARSRLAALPDG